MNKVKIFKSSPIKERVVRIPSSKSDAHRKIIASSLCFNQTSVIDGVDFSNDINMTIDAMKNFANIQVEGNRLIISSKKTDASLVTFDAGESGSTLRFLIPLFSYFFEKTIIKGTKRLLERPLEIYQDILKDGLIISEEEVHINKPIQANEYHIPGDISSQFISGLLFVLPLLKVDSKINIIGKYESKSYVDMTIKVLDEFGIKIIQQGNSYIIKGNQKYQATSTKVEGDCSQLGFYVVLGAINNEVKVTNIPEDTLQGDYQIIKIAKEFNVEVINNHGDYTFSCDKLKGNHLIDLENIPDLGPILFVLAAINEGETKFINTRRLRIKESDRILSMKEELAKFNIFIEDYDNEVIIRNQKMQCPKEEINPHNDHRILMAISILSTLVDKVVINDVKCVNKSYPKFYDDLFNLGIKGELYD